LLLIRAGALGDVVLTLPAIQGLRDANQRLRIHVVGYPAIWEIAGSLIDAVTPIDHPRFAGLFSDTAPAELRGWLAGFDAAVAWTVRDPRLILHAAGIPTVHATPYPPPGVHAATWLLQSLDLPQDHASIARLVRQLASIFPPVTTSPPHRTTFIHPGAGASWKRWPASRFARVADALADGGHAVSIIEGPADSEAVAEMLHHVSRSYPVIRAQSLPCLASMLARGTLYIGNDSGVTHLAAMAGTPTIALFGPTDPTSWAPLGDVAVIRRCAATATAQGQVRICDDPRCMEAISVEDVLAAAAP
jgi:heptosyltransferase III